MLANSRITLYLVFMPMMMALTDDQPYCAVRYQRLCQGKGPHVACQFPEVGPGELCQNYTEIKFTKELKNFIIHYINRRRQRIAAGNERVRGGIQLPQPEVMMYVEWDRELALLAQRLADQCVFVHDKCRATVRYPYAGQTVGEVRWRRSSESDELTAQRAIHRVFDAWWGERRRVQPKQLIAPFRLTAKGAVWGHFSQLAVWTLCAVGCGAVRHGANYPRLLLVCDFSHTNMLGQRTISPGPLASCPVHTARKSKAYPLLCITVRKKTLQELESIEDSESDEEVEDIDEEDDDDISNDNMTKYYGVFLRKFTRKRLTNKYVKPKEIQSTRAVQTRTTRIEDDPMSEGGIEKEMPTERRLINKLDRVLEMRKKADTKSRVNGKYNDWYTRRSNIGKWRENIKIFSQMEITTPSINPKLHLPDINDSDIAQFKGMFETTTGPTESLVIRHRWKQTRDRPRRPGANALLNVPTVIQSRRPPIAPLTLDKDDIEQLFRDTGFNLNWRRKDVEVPKSNMN
ncbi:uncharacterized protein LOC113514485 [Galleria mellonella]|uniref:Uncharacterized protein LOC113514485 n=1 Tax=Galleria mellonella TaxID=7137 RepID=A0A6J3BUV0_GALME|nr:uncharacterized protein LOC113514485 [Galleria mellonella]